MYIQKGWGREHMSVQSLIVLMVNFVLKGRRGSNRRQEVRVASELTIQKANTNAKSGKNVARVIIM